MCWSDPRAILKNEQEILMSIAIGKVELRNLFLHKSTDLVLPKRGIVLVTGPNGSGKSGLIEGVSVAVFGKTLRGTPPWSQGHACSATAYASGAHPLVVTRANAKGKTTLAWGPPGKGPGTTYESTTKAQEALEAVVGSWNVWRRSAVFSSSDASHFTLARDGERKALLEEILGLSEFDIALSHCRSDLKYAEAALDSARREEEKWSIQLAERSKHLEELQGMNLIEPSNPIGVVKLDTEPLQNEVTRLHALVKGCEKDQADLRKQHLTISSTGGEDKAKLAELTRRSSMLSKEKCPTCLQPISSETRRRLDEEIGKVRLAAEKAELASRKEFASLNDGMIDSDSELEALNAKLSAARRELTEAEQTNVAEQQRYDNALVVYERDLAAYESLAERLSRADAAVHEASAAQFDAAVGLGKHEKGVAVLRAVEQVLGLRGLRAHVLGSALSGLEAVANHWLARICGNNELRLELKPYTEQKTGGIADAISLEVVGAGGGYGYRASSGGERRRIDIALLLALAEVAGAAHRSAEDSTLFFDECMDALDEDGADAVASALYDLAKNRAVLVITHSEVLSSRIEADVRLRVENGTVITL
jgi:DNA repair exonuclease SbcCD ATPase subunit